MVTIYEIKQGESLQQIAERFDMTSEELQTFHNLHCKEVGLMWFNNFVGITKIAIPAGFKSKAVRLKEHKQFFPPKTFFNEFYASKYLVTEHYESNEENFDVNYEIHLNIEDSDEGKIINVSKKNFKKNGESVDGKMAELAIACMEVIEPIGFTIDDSGLLKSLAWPKKYLERFSGKRDELQGFFAGEINASYFDKFEESLQNYDLMFQNFNSQLIFQLLFPGMKIFHHPKTWHGKAKPVQGSFAINFNFQAIYNNEENEFSISEIIGTNSEPLNLANLLRRVKTNHPNDEESRITYTRNYKTDKISKQLHSAEAKIIFSLSDEVYATHYCTLVRSEQ